MPRTPLQPGENSIDRTTPKKQADGSYHLRWRIRLQDGKILARRTQGPTIGETRRRARDTAKEILTTGGGGTWRSSSKISDYITQISTPAVESADLRPKTVVRYKEVLGLLIGTCRKKDHRHAHSLAGYSIADATRFRTLERCLQEIAQLHGSESARQAKNVTSKFVLQQLIRDGVIDANPLVGMDINLGKNKTTAHPGGGQALTAEEYEAVLLHLLSLDPAEGVEPPKRGMYTLADKVAKRRAVIDLTLLQAATGLRVTEARTLPWKLVTVDGDGIVHVTVTEDISKTHKGRTVPVLDDRIAQHLLDRRDTIGGKLVIGAPTSPDTMWDQSNCTKAIKELYVELAAATGIELLRTARSHVWRTTLNGLYINLPSEIRSAFFGHDPAVNRRHYTDTTDTSAMVSAAQKRRRRHLKAI